MSAGGGASVGNSYGSVCIAVESVEQFHEVEGRAAARAERITENVRRTVSVDRVGVRRVRILADQDCLLVGSHVAEQVYHILVLRFAVAVFPCVLVEAVQARIHYGAGCLVCFGEVADAGCLPGALVEADDPDTCLFAKTCKSPGNGLVVLGDRAGIKHRLCLVGEGCITVCVSVD